MKEVAFYYLEQNRFADAYRARQGALKAPTVNPYLFLGCAQASHQQGAFDWCTKYAVEAKKYSNKFAPLDKIKNRTHAEYLKCVCEHDIYFAQTREDQSISDEEKEDILGALYQTWERFIDNNEGEGDVRDAKQRMAEVETELLTRN